MNKGFNKCCWYGNYGIYGISGCFSGCFLMFLWSVSVVSVCSTSLFRTTWSCRCRRCRRCPAHQRAHPERFEQRRLGAQLGSQGTQRAHGNPKGFSPFLDAIGFQQFFLKHVLYIIIHYYTLLYNIYTTYILIQNVYNMHQYVLYAFACHVSVSVCFCV